MIDLRIGSVPAALALLLSSSVVHGAAEGPTGSGDFRVNDWQFAPSASAVTGSAFDIVINPGANLLANPDALAAFERAATTWESHFSDPILVTIDADLEVIADANVIGSANSVSLVAAYDVIRGQMVVDSFGDPLMSALPTAAQVDFTMPVGFSFSGDLSFTKANAKALGFTDLDSLFGVSDATITFNSSFSFDYDNSDGVGAGLTDFETVALHEIGHALGFVSEVDFVDFALDQGGTAALNPTTLDLFRFADGSADDPSTLGEFTTASRNLVPGGTPIFDDLSTEILLSTGVTQGDGRQASHWKDSLGLGVLDPTLAPQEVVTLTVGDLRAFDLIGYDLIPEPSVALLGLLGGVFVTRRRRSRR